MMLKAVNIICPAVVDPGSAPEMQWGEIGDLDVDLAYQRPLGAAGLRNIQKIADGFAWNRFSPVIVTPNPPGRWWVIDGQHRAIGLQQVPAYVVDAAPGEAAAINGQVTPMTPQGLYKAALAAGAEWAVTLQRLTRAAGLEILLYPVPRAKQKPRQTMVVGTLRNKLARHGEARIAAALAHAMAQPGADTPGYFTTDVLQAAINATAPEIDDETAIFIYEEYCLGRSAAQLASELRVPLHDVQRIIAEADAE